MMAFETIVPSTKLKIKFSTKRIEVDPGKKCEFVQKGSQVDERGCCNSKEKYHVPGSNKRGPQGSLEAPKEKRQKMCRKASLQCATTLKSLTSHPYGWVFSKPVDPVALNIPDYFRVISEPMDLGTIKFKLDKNMYSDIEEFAADVRLTFSNAMAYNPPSNEVHLMAKELNKIFQRKLKDLEKKLKCEDETGAVKETVRKGCNGMDTMQKDTLPKRSQVPEQKGIQKISLLGGRDAKVPKQPTSSQITCKLIVKDLHKGNTISRDVGHPSGLVKPCTSSGLVTTPSNSTHASSDICSEESEGRDPHACDAADALRLDCQAKCKSPFLRKADSGGAVSAPDSEHACSSSQLTTPATDASSGEVWSTPVFDAQLSPKKALRAAMLKSRFADTILKAQQKTLLNHGGKNDPLKMQLEKERLERMQHEERAKIEAQVKAAEAAARKRAEEELKQHREKEREAARLAIQKMERTVEMEHNLDILKELEMLCGCTLSFQFLSRNDGSEVAMETLDKPQVGNPLERLGLFIKDEYSADENEDEVLSEGWEDGEIF